MTADLLDRTGAPRRRRGPWFELVAVALALAVVAVAALAVTRHLSQPGDPVLPLSWCRAGTPDTLPPLLGPAILTVWHLDAIAVAVVAVVGLLYAAGAVFASRRSARRWPVSRSVAFAGGLVVCLLATNSSVGVYDMALFSAHMVGHLMLVMLAPVLLCAGHPLTLLVEAPSAVWSARMRRVLHSGPVTLLFAPPVALACYAAVIVGSHLTGLMDTIMRYAWAGQLEHLVYVLVGMQFFTLVVAREPIRWDLTTPARWVLLAISMAVDTFTGIVLLMSSQAIAMMPVDGLYVNTLTDTRTGGAIMWVGGDGLMALVMIVIGRRWLRSPELRRRDSSGIVERVRRSTFAERTGAAPTNEPAEDFDEIEARRVEYNKWLASLEDRSQTAAGTGGGSGPTTRT